MVLLLGRGESTWGTSMISIVDDEECVREAVRGLVRSFGFDAYAFSSAETFLKSSRLSDTACVITDIQMPGMSGMELQDVLIAQDRPVPIIFMTTFPDERIRQRVLNAGAVGFLVKPFSDGCLINCMKTAQRIID